MSYITQTPASRRRLHQSTRGGVDNRGQYVTAGWSVAYPELWDFLAVASGLPEDVGGGTIRVVPLRFPDRPTMLGTSIQWEAIGYDQATKNYSDARVFMEFRTPEFNLSGGDAFLTRRRRRGGNFITIPGTCYKFGDNSRVDQDVGRFVQETEYVFQYYQKPVINEAVLDALNGKINAAEFEGKAAETLLFAGSEDEVSVDTGGAQHLGMQVSIVHRGVPWNHLMHPSGSGFALVTDGTGAGIYQTADFSLLYDL